MARTKGSKNSKSKTKKKNNWIPPKIFNDPRYPLAKYIIDKFVDIREVNPYRDFTTAFKLIRKFNSKFFWQQLPCEFRIKNLSVFLFGKALEKLTMLWCVYQKRITIDKKIKVDVKNNIE